MHGANRIVVLDRGRVEETGSPAELAARVGGAYLVGRAVTGAGADGEQLLESGRIQVPGIEGITRHLHRISWHCRWWHHWEVDVSRVITAAMVKVYCTVCAHVQLPRERIPGAAPHSS